MNSGDVGSGAIGPWTIDLDPRGGDITHGGKGDSESEPGEGTSASGDH
jgi:hypothetical protein